MVAHTQFKLGGTFECDKESPKANVGEWCVVAWVDTAAANNTATIITTADEAAADAVAAFAVSLAGGDGSGGITEFTNVAHVAEIARVHKDQTKAMMPYISSSWQSAFEEPARVPRSVDPWVGQTVTVVQVMLYDDGTPMPVGAVITNADLAD